MLEMILMMIMISNINYCIGYELTYIMKPKDCENKKKVEDLDYVTFNYVGMIDESSKTGDRGKIFDQSSKGSPIVTQMKKGQGIDGFRGLIGVCVGSKISLVVPPEEAYGDQGAGDIVPPGATLKFNIEIVTSSKTSPKNLPNVFAQIDSNRDDKISKEEALDFFKKNGLKEVPSHIWKEDIDGDGYISWEEFSGPKGDKAPSKSEKKASKADKQVDL